MTESSQQPMLLEEIESELGIVFPAGYKKLVLDNERTGQVKEYHLENFNEYTAWAIRFIRPDASFKRSIAAVSEIVLEPRKIIPFAWSVSSGDWLVFDYRKTDAEPPILYIDHERGCGTMRPRRK